MTAKSELLLELQATRGAFEVAPPPQRFLLCSAYCARVAPVLEAEIPGVDPGAFLQVAFAASLSVAGGRSEPALVAEAGDVVARAQDEELGAAVDVALSLYHLTMGPAAISELTEAAERAAWGAAGNQGDAVRRRDFHRGRAAVAARCRRVGVGALGPVHLRHAGAAVRVPADLVPRLPRPLPFGPLADGSATGFAVRGRNAVDSPPT